MRRPATLRLRGQPARPIAILAALVLPAAVALLLEVLTMWAAAVVAQSLWLALLVVLVPAGLAALAERTWRERWGLLALFGFSLGLRVVFATWGPGDQNYNLLSAFSAEINPEYYGVAAPAFHRFLWHVLAPGHESIIQAHLVLGSLVAPLLVLLVAKGSGEAVARWTAGLAVALHPLLVRHAGEANRQALLLFAILVALNALAVFVRRGHLVALLRAALAGALVVHIRPEAGAYLAALAGGFGLWVVHGRPRGRRHAAGVRLAAFLASIVVAASVCGWKFLDQPSLAERPSFPGGLLDSNAWTDPGLTPVPFLVVTLVGAAWLLARRRVAVLWLLAALAILSLLASRLYATTGANLANARYHAAALLPFLALMGLVLGAFADAVVARLGTRRGGLLVAIVGLALAASAVGPFSGVVSPRGVDQEMSFLRAHRQDIPQGLPIYVVEPEADAGLKHVVLTFRAVLGRGDWRAWDEAGPPGLYYHTTACWMKARLSPARAQACRDGLARYGERPLLELVLEGPNIEGHPFDDPRPRVGLYDMRGASDGD